MAEPGEFGRNPALSRFCCTAYSLWMGRCQEWRSIKLTGSPAPAAIMPAGDLRVS